MLEVCPGTDRIVLLSASTDVAVAEQSAQDAIAVEVKVIVETVFEVVTKVVEPEVTVSVTGHVVTVS